MLTDKISTKKGAMVTLIIWILVMIGISAGPKLADYKASNFQSLPDDVQSILAEKELTNYFQMTSALGILVFIIQMRSCSRGC
jgi:RND superfamily putative drug exporter